MGAECMCVVQVYAVQFSVPSCLRANTQWSTCSNCCGLDIGVKNGKVVGVRGRAVDRVNKGRLGPKGLTG